MKREKRVVKVGNVFIGGTHPIVVQSMTKTRTSDIRKTVAQIKRLQNVGCEIVRLAVLNRADADALKEIKKNVQIPLVADIHFDYRLALQAIDSGVNKIRINPGNIGEEWKVTEVIKKAKDKGIPIRIGINSGSLPPKILQKYRHPTTEAMMDTLDEILEIFYKNNFLDIVISAKCPDVLKTVEIYETIHNRYDFPLHLGITESGLLFSGSIRSAIGIGILLYKGIGDTIRVSLADKPEKEVIAGYEILKALNLREYGPKLIVCPTCGRCEVDLLKIAREVEKKLTKIKIPLTIAVMGCVVNGPGEAKEADFGIACGKGIGTIFAKGREIKRVKENRLIDTLFEVIYENINN
ncbi:MAG: flavodoxin-dependent (E)-4-hydroxy-3-methylbut-2-enyl-diphosphate synthase [candidate division WOR-3 bacterium]|nr:flavodoxin-dependent (E)-4-hydroxy-3-methylbut-2-enyl-diphosphate synthase [candidate division WOR-3 bacterium]